MARERTPILSLGAPAIDAAMVQVPGRTYLSADEAGIPTANLPVAGTPYDLQSLQQVGGRRMDVAYTATRTAGSWPGAGQTGAGGRHSGSGIVGGRGLPIPANLYRRHAAPT